MECLQKGWDIILTIEELKSFLLRWGNLTRMPAVIVSIKYCAGCPKQHNKADRQKQINKDLRDEGEKQNSFVYMCDYFIDIQRNLQMNYTNNRV